MSCNISDSTFLNNSLHRNNKYICHILWYHEPSIICMTTQFNIFFLYSEKPNDAQPYIHAGVYGRGGLRTEAEIDHLKIG